MDGIRAKLRGLDLYRKVPKDLTEATLAGGTISIIAATVGDRADADCQGSYCIESLSSEWPISRSIVAMLISAVTLFDDGHIEVLILRPCPRR